MINLQLQISEDSVHLYRVFFCVLKVDQGDGVPSSFWNDSQSLWTGRIPGLEKYLKK